MKPQHPRFALPPDIARMLRLFGFTVLATLAGQSVISCYSYQHSPESQGRTLVDSAHLAFQEKILKKFF